MNASVVSAMLRSAPGLVIALAGVRWALAVVVLLLPSLHALACDGPPLPLAQLIREADAIATVTMVPNPQHRDREPLTFVVNERIKGLLQAVDQLTIVGVSMESEFYGVACGSPSILVFLRPDPKGGWRTYGMPAYSTVGASNLLLHATKDYAEALACRDDAERARRILAVSLKYVSVPDCPGTVDLVFLRRDCARNIHNLVVKAANGPTLSKIEKAHIMKTMEETYDGSVLAALFPTVYAEMKEERRVLLLRRFVCDREFVDSDNVLEPLLAHQDALVEKAIIEKLRAKPKERPAGDYFRVLRCASEAVRKKAIQEFKGDADHGPYAKDLESSLPQKVP